MLSLNQNYENRTIGLLGGSFNPAHAGHLHITQFALKRLKLDEVWWLVSPRNPLKSADSLADYAQRLESARQIASADRRIRVLNIEAAQDLRYSWQTIQWLRRRHRKAQFIWLMGADNLAVFHRWQRWTWILETIPVVVFDRAPYSHTALRSRASLRASRNRLNHNAINGENMRKGIAFFHLRRDAHTATDLRKKLGKKAFLRYGERTDASLSAFIQEKRP